MDHWTYVSHQVMIRAAPSKDLAQRYINNNVTEPIIKIILLNQIKQRNKL